MNPPRTMKYNPAFLGEDQLIASFATRSRDLEAILEVIRENTGPSNQHVIVIGPRGIGKTTFVLRVAAELRRTPDLAALVYPIVFSEESYEVHSAATLWLEALFHLGRQTGAARWSDAYERLRGELDPDRLRTLALAELRDFSEAEGKRLVVIVENFNTIIGQQVSDDDAWTLRHTLINEPRIMLLATATSRFDGIDHREQAMFDLFRVHHLDPLASHECAELWHHLTGRVIDERQGRAIEILTGGNPRLLTILSSLTTDAPLHTLADDLTRLVDEHTDYFKAHIESLSSQGQRVFVALADIWAPATAQELAERTRLTVNTVSAVLARLERDGFVTAALVSARRKRYQLSERLYNIYYLLRRRGGVAERVRFSVEFIAAYYDADALVEKLLALADDTAEKPPAQRPEYIHAFFSLYTKIARSHRGLLLPRLPRRFLELPELSEEQRERLRGDLASAQADQKWFFDVWNEWWASHRVLREGWALACSQPTFAHCWAELLSSMRGEASPQVAGAHIAARAADLTRELERLRSRLRRLCRDVLSNSPSWVDLVVCGALAFWLDDEPIFNRAWQLAHARWADNPWLQLARFAFEDLVIHERTARFIARTGALLADRQDSIWLPAAAGLLLDIEGEEAAAASFYRASPLSGRLPALVSALTEIYGELLEHEHELVTDPRLARFAPLLQPTKWIGFFAWLGRFAAVRLDRPNDAATLLQLVSETFPDSGELQLVLGTVLFRLPDRADEGLAVLRRAVKRPTSSWRLDAAVASVLAQPLGQTETALQAFGTSWRAFSATPEAEAPPRARVKAWLQPVTELLPGPQLAERFLALLQPSRSKLHRELTTLLTSRTHTQGQQQTLILVVVALAMRGARRALLDRLQGSPAAQSIEPLIAGLALSLGDDIAAPHEIAVTARDIAEDIRLFAGLYELVYGPGED